MAAFDVGDSSFPNTPQAQSADWSLLDRAGDEDRLPTLPSATPVTDNSLPVPNLRLNFDNSNEATRPHDPTAFNGIFSDISLGLGMPVIAALSLDVATRGRFNATGRVLSFYGRGATQLGHGAVYALREFGPPAGQAVQRLCQTVARAVRQTGAGHIVP